MLKPFDEREGMEARPASRGAAVWMGVAVVVLLPLLYLLAAGPALFLSSHGWLSYDQSLWIYGCFEPAYKVSDHVPVLERYYSWCFAKAWESYGTPIAP